MKVIKEDVNITEPIPAEILADLVSQCWGQLSSLKGQIEGFKTFSDGDKVIGPLQALVDAYFVCVGQLEGQVPQAKCAAPQTEVIIQPTLPPEFETAATVNANPVQPEPVISVEVPEEPEEKPIAAAEPFEYFVDFDTPEPDEKADDEIKKAKKQLTGEVDDDPGYEIIEF